MLYSIPVLNFEFQNPLLFKTHLEVNQSFSHLTLHGPNAFQRCTFVQKRVDFDFQHCAIEVFPLNPKPARDGNKKWTLSELLECRNPNLKLGWHNKHNTYTSNTTMVEAKGLRWNSLEHHEIPSLFNPTFLTIAICNCFQNLKGSETLNPSKEPVRKNSECKWHNKNKEIDLHYDSLLEFRPCI